MTRILRCAVYTRKSSEEGLDQSFNSLDAQREACEAYIRSQAHEGWQPVPGSYDDGGYSGGSMERPGLRRLLADIASGRIDVVVVYKIDRLTRSLADFARMVEVFDRSGASFVAVTQQFNTTSSMGRLTLNVLLSFAQFEREVTGERIRDKIAASKRKGMWMGGPTPLGYDGKDRTLVPNPTEAETVNRLFRLYVEHRSVEATMQKAKELGLVSKRRTQGGKPTGGGLIGRGAMYRLLSNPIYVGDIAHKGERHPGTHPGIVPKALFEEAQAILGANRHEHRAGTRAAEPSLLAGLVVDGAGRRMVPTHTSRASRRYRYYATATPPALRLAAQELERPVLARTLAWLRSDADLVDSAREAGMNHDLRSLRERARAIADKLEGATPTEQRAILQRFLRLVEVHHDRLVLHLRPQALLDRMSPDASTVALVVAARMHAARRGLALTVDAPGAAVVRTDPALIAMIARGRAWFEEIVADRTTTFGDVAAREGVSRGYVGHLIDLAFLAPDVVVRISEGRQPPTLTPQTLKALSPLPIEWDDQRRSFED